MIRTAEMSFGGMNFYWLFLGSLAVWRLTHLLNAEDGPWDIFVIFRRWVGTGLWGRLLDCFYCLSVWISIPVSIYLGQSWKERLLLCPALSGAAILLERIGNRKPTADAAVGALTTQYFEVAEETNDVLLREQAREVKDAGRVH